MPKKRNRPPTKRYTPPTPWADRMPSGYIHRPLSDLIGQSPSVEIVQYPSQYTPEQLASALMVVEPLLRPYPAVRIADWFWETLAGKQVAQAQWMAYEAEALTPSVACRLIWGENDENRLMALQKLVLKGEVHLYRRPNNILAVPGKVGRPFRPFYLRRSEVEAHVRRVAVLAAEKKRQSEAKRTWIQRRHEEKEAAKRAAMEINR